MRAMANRVEPTGYEKVVHMRLETCSYQLVATKFRAHMCVIAIIYTELFAQT